MPPPASRSRRTCCRPTHPRAAQQQRARRRRPRARTSRDALPSRTANSLRPPAPASLAAPPARLSAPRQGVTDGRRLLDQVVTPALGCRRQRPDRGDTVGVDAALPTWRTSTRRPRRRCTRWPGRRCWPRSTTAGPTRAGSTRRPAGPASCSTRPRAAAPRLGVRPDEVSFTASGTAAAHAAVLGGLAGRAPGRAARLVHSAIEHSAVLHAADGTSAPAAAPPRCGVDRLGPGRPGRVRGGRRARPGSRWPR